MSVTGRRDGEPGAGPQKVGVALTDVLTGLYATTAILAALTHRERTGEGQHIDLALLDVAVASLANQTMNYLDLGRGAGRGWATRTRTWCRTRTSRRRTANMILAVGNDGQFARLCAALDHPEWAPTRAIATNAARIANRDTLDPGTGARVRARRTTADWIATFESEGVPCGPINTLAEVFADPQVQARGMQHAMRHGAGAEVQLVANPVRMSATPPSYRLPPPLLGADTRAVLAERLGMSAAEIDALAAMRAI